MPGFTLAPGTDPVDVAAAQSGLARALGAVSPAVADRVLIVVGEIAANCAEHGVGTVSVEWRVGDGSVHLDVIGPGPSAAQIRQATLPPDDAVRGRGLFLIGALATTVEPLPNGIRLRFDD